MHTATIEVDEFVSTVTEEATTPQATTSSVAEIETVLLQNATTQFTLEPTSNTSQASTLNEIETVLPQSTTNSTLKTTSSSSTTSTVLLTTQSTIQGKLGSFLFHFTGLVIELPVLCHHRFTPIGFWCEPGRAQKIFKVSVVLKLLLSTDDTIKTGL